MSVFLSRVFDEETPAGRRCDLAENRELAGVTGPEGCWSDGRRPAISLRSVRASLSCPRENPGRCRFCGCTENDPCHIGRYLTCYWIDETKTVCSNLACVEAEIAEVIDRMELARR